MERNEEKRKREGEASAPSEPVPAGNEGIEGSTGGQEGGSSSSSSAPPAVPSAVTPASTSRKRGAGDQLDQARDPPGFLSGGDPLERSSPTKRPAEGDPEIRWRTGDKSGSQSREEEAKERRNDLIESLVSVLEDEGEGTARGGGQLMTAQGQGVRLSAPWRHSDV